MMGGFGNSRIGVVKVSNENGVKSRYSFDGFGINRRDAEGYMPRILTGSRDLRGDPEFIQFCSSAVEAGAIQDDLGLSPQQLVEQRTALLAVARSVAWTYEKEQHDGKFPEGRTWVTIPHDMGQSARRAVDIAERRNRSGDEHDVEQVQEEGRGVSR
jgi:hypothetical protein